MIRAAGALAVVITAGAAQADRRWDEDLAAGDRSHPVFVRMADQLFPRGGAFEAFCAEHADDRRTELRREVLATLRAKSDASRAAVGAALGEIAGVGGVRWFWIVNGFACDATGDAVRSLAALPGVAWVYRQRQPGRWVQHRTTPLPARRAAIGREGLRAALAGAGDEAPFSADGLEVPWNLERIGADRAWATTRGEGVVVAVLDSGLLPTPPLLRALWRNPGEELNGEDDDGNGHTDDLCGWDCEQDAPFVIGDGERSHGTMCAGIIAGRPWGEPRTVTGVAPRARLMMLRGMGRLSAYEYAAANGADVLSMSYMWVGVELGDYRGLYRTAHEHLAACGVVAVGGAGNFKRSAPAGRQIALPKDVPCVIAVAGIHEDGEQAPYSSEGPCTWHGVRFFDDFPAGAPLGKPDVTACSGGFPVWHRTAVGGRQVEVRWADERSGIGLVVGPRGNSFAGPHAAGTAALMLSANPDLCAWRVKELMEATARDLGEAGRDAAFGAGLIRADAAVAAAAAAAR